MYKPKETHLHDSLFRRIRARQATIFISFYLLHSSSLRAQTPFSTFILTPWWTKAEIVASSRRLRLQLINTNTTEDFSKLILPLEHIEGIVCFFLFYQSFPGIFVCTPVLYPHVSCVSQQVQEPWKKHDFSSFHVNKIRFRIHKTGSLQSWDKVAFSSETRMLVCIILNL